MYLNPRRGRPLSQVELNMAMYSATHATKQYWLQESGSLERRQLWRAVVEMWHVCARPSAEDVQASWSHKNGLVTLG
jgi:hypothetical protein